MTSQVVKRKSPSAPSKKPGTLSLRPLVKDLPFLFLALALAFAVALPPCSGSYNGFVKTKPANATKSNITTYLNNTEVQQICSAACAGTAGNGSLGAHLGLGLNGSALNKTHTSRKSSPVCLADCTVREPHSHAVEYRAIARYSTVLYNVAQCSSSSPRQRPCLMADFKMGTKSHSNTDEKE